ncbi:MAG: class I SAM-dependent methyltransferase [Hyphomicrobiales bacterium]|nr:class I SAM-dependent methyltransferase [Hyphomicrobiales bacterium]
MTTVAEKQLLQPNPATQGFRCKLCGGNRFKLRHEWDIGDIWNQTKIPLALWDCEDCGLCMLSPVPKPEDYPGQGDWFTPEKKDLSRKYWFKTFRRRLSDRLVGTKKERFYRQCVQAVSSGRFLDVGCGTGALMELAAKNFDEVVGVDPSPIACEVVRGKGFRVHQGLLEEVKLERDYFDMISMDSVIEHVLDPVAVMRRCYDALCPGGYLGMVTVKLNGLTNRYRGAGWNGYRHGWHTILFTEKTLQACLDKAGFEYVRRPRRARPLDDMLILWGRKPLPMGGGR